MRICCAAALLLLAGAVRPLAPVRGELPAKAKDDKGELHVVGIYEGFTKTDGKLHGGKARVLLDRPKQRVTLVLVTYDRVTWEVSVGADTKLERVILGGADRADVKGLPAGVEVVEGFRGSKDATVPFCAYTTEAPEYHRLLEGLADKFGHKRLASFTGTYRAKADALIEVNTVQAEDRLSVDYPVPAPAAHLPKLSFSAVHSTFGKHPHEVSRSFGEFTLTGPKADTLKPLPRNVSRVVYDPVGKKHYGIARHALAEIDFEKQEATEIDIGFAVPKISWPNNVTFDTKRNRVLLTTSGGGGILYSYTPKTGKWEALAEKPPAVVTYHPKTDALYGLKGDLRGLDPVELQELNAAGIVVNSVKLDGAFLPGTLTTGPGVTGVQMSAAGDKLVLLLTPGERLNSSGQPSKWSYTYLVDQKTGKAQLTHKGMVGEK
ncbi:hypothetical protein R5W23_003488 [Gemmata sp. JC673]|uniref:Uncharacterized protein n=1 Tax=Gemmata algarum TaxID=2975278 RepID=A0ABU5F383_9BACT|nr:hypothetical protein [Gemmata algarum]MDY3562042.1 hypothetical protein [Gemmata algarum]